MLSVGLGATLNGPIPDGSVASTAPLRVLMTVTLPDSSLAT
jgi:hypothetical protein